MKLHIHIRDGIEEADALARVARVVQNGKISTTRGIRHYCHVTTWEDGVAVSCRPNSADSFHFAVWPFGEK